MSSGTATYSLTLPSKVPPNVTCMLYSTIDRRDTGEDAIARQVLQSQTRGEMIPLYSLGYGFQLITEFFPPQITHSEQPHLTSQD